MRVTKNVKNYIRKEVSARIHKKYEAEEAQAKRERELRDKVYDDCCQAALEVIKNTAAKANLDFMEYNFTEKSIHLYYSSFNIKNSKNVNSCHRWKQRCRAEVDEKTNEIIVELELGGDKTKLMEMLEAL